MPLPTRLMYVLTREEYDSLRPQIASLKEKTRGAHAKYLPFAFTEQGIAMLSGVLHSGIAINMNIAIMRAFIEVRQFVLEYNGLAEQITEIKQSVSNHQEQLRKMYAVIERLLNEKKQQKKWVDRDRIGFVK